MVPRLTTKLDEAVSIVIRLDLEIQLYVKTLLLAAINDYFGYDHDDDYVGYLPLYLLWFWPIVMLLVGLERLCWLIVMNGFVAPPKKTSKPAGNAARGL